MTPAERDEMLPYAPGPDPNKLRTLAEIQADLRRRVHPSEIDKLPKGGGQFDYIEWHTAIRILEKYAPGWQEDTTITASGDQVIAIVHLRIPTSDQGVVQRSGDGQDHNDPKAYGEASNRAYSQALRRACAKFGLFLYSYYEGK